MTWPREESRPRIAPDSRRAGLLTLVIGGLVVAGLLVVLVPTEARYGSAKLYCGTPLSAAFKSAGDYVTEYVQQHGPRPAPGGNTSGYSDDVPVPPGGLPAAGAACVSSGRTRGSVGGGLVLLALLIGAGTLVAARRRRADLDG